MKILIMNIIVKKPIITKPILIFLWSLLESNQPPTDYESVALTE